VADDLGIGLSTLSRWISEDRSIVEPVVAQGDLQAELSGPFAVDTSAGKDRKTEGH
jgi:hypothetical protein